MTSARAVLILILGAAAPGFVACGTRPAPVVKGVWEGVYTEAQAKRGSVIYEIHCMKCHAPDLSGDTPYDPSPQLAGRAFLFRWDKKNMDELFLLARTQMPRDKPGTLKSEEYADVLAFILQANQFPAANSELTTNLYELHHVRIVKQAPQQVRAVTNTSS